MANGFTNELSISSLAIIQDRTFESRKAGRPYDLSIGAELISPSAHIPDLILSISDRVAIRRALEVSRAAGLEKGRSTQTAVYVIEADGRGLCKIGIGCEPAKRRDGLQVGSPDKLIIHALVWANLASARLLERSCHEGAREANVRGEWFNLSPADAVKLLASNIVKFDADYSDCSMWLRNRARLLVEKKRAQHEHSQNLPCYPERKIPRSRLRTG